jgi:hypothetical protein
MKHIIIQLHLCQTRIENERMGKRMELRRRGIKEEIIRKGVESKD